MLLTEYMTTARALSDLQQPVAQDDVLAMCRCAFPLVQPTAHRLTLFALLYLPCALVWAALDARRIRRKASGGAAWR